MRSVRNVGDPLRGRAMRGCRAAHSLRDRSYPYRKKVLDKGNRPRYSPFRVGNPALRTTEKINADYS
jgi:hypothetical protein